MKIINRYLIEFNLSNNFHTKICEVIELLNGNFYRIEVDENGINYISMDKEEMYEAIANSKL